MGLGGLKSYLFGVTMLIGVAILPAVRGAIDGY